MTSRELVEVMILGLLIWVSAYCAILHVLAFVSGLYLTGM